MSGLGQVKSGSPVAEVLAGVGGEVVWGCYPAPALTVSVTPLRPYPGFVHAPWSWSAVAQLTARERVTLDLIAPGAVQ